MKKNLQFFSLMIALLAIFQTQAQNLISGWNGNGKGSTADVASSFGWSASPTTTWGAANSTSTDRYRDDIIYDSNTARVLATSQTRTRIYAFPFTTASAGKYYTFTGKFGFINGGDGTGSFKIYMNSNATNTGTSYYTSGNYSSAQTRLNTNISFNFVVPTASSSNYFIYSNLSNNRGIFTALSITQAGDAAIVTFDTNGGSSVASSPYFVPGTSYTVSRPSDPTKTDYNFAGWYTDATYATLFNFATPVTNSTTIYAKFTQDPLITVSQPLSFTTSSYQNTFTVQGANITADVTFTTLPSGITLSGTNLVDNLDGTYKILQANANTTNTITATWGRANNISSQNITVESTGAVSQNVTITTTSDVETVALSGITLSAGGLNAPFAVGTTTYTAKVPADLSSTTVTANTTPTIANVTNNNTAISASTTSVVLTGNSFNGANHTSEYMVNWGGNYTISDWAANGSTDATLSVPTVYGWSATPTLGWGAANSAVAGTVRYIDNPASYTYGGNPWTGRILYVRWDGGALTRVYSYPVYLETCKTYNFTGKAAYNSVVASGTLTFRINTAKDNTGTSYGTGGTVSLGATQYALQNVSLNSITVPTSGVYYLTITSSNGAMDAIADLSIAEDLTTSLSKSVTSLAFTTVAAEKTFTVTGNGLSGEVTLAAPTGVTLVPTTVSALDAQCGRTITATWDKAANVTGNITLNSTGLSEQTISITTSDVEISTLSGVTLGTGGFLSPTFDAGTTSYSIYAPADISSVTVTGTATSSVASISNNGNPVSLGNPVTLGCTSYNTLNTTNYTFNWGGNYAISDWAANGNSTSTSASSPSTYGWKCMNNTTPPAVEELIWNNFGTQSNCRYSEKTTGGGYSYFGTEWTGRILYIRWDAGGLTNRVFSYPVYLETGTTYQVNGKAAYNSNATAPTLGFKINAAKDNSGTDFASTNIVTAGSGVLKDIKLINISVPSSGVYYLTISSNTASLCAIADLTLNTQITETFNGSVDNAWSNSANWTTRVPLAGDNVTLSTGNLAIDQNAAANQITVSSAAKLTINSGKELSAAVLTLQSDETGTATLVNSGTANITSANIQQYLGAARNWYISTPIDQVTSPFSNINRYFEYVEAGNNVVSSDPVIPGETGYWKGYAAGFPMAKGKGYIAQVSAPTTITYSGNSLNVADETVTLSKTDGVNKSGFNLIGNPFPAYLDVRTNIEGNANLSKTVWYRTRTIGASPLYKYETVNTTSGEGTDNAGHGRTVTGYIPPMQAFWVKAGANTTLTLSKSATSHALVAGGTITTPLKSPSVTTQRLRLKVSNGVTSDESLIYFNTNAQDGLDNYDSPKMFENSASVPEIFTTAGSENLVINGMNTYNYGTSIPIGLKVGETNTYTIQASQIQNFDADTKIVLVDNLLNTQTDLTAGSSYTFTSDATTTTTRFNVLFKSASGTTSVDNQMNNLKIYTTENKILVDYFAAVINDASVSVYNGVGQKLYEQKLKGNKTTINKDFEAGVYLVKVSQGSNVVTNKVIIR